MSPVAASVVQELEATQGAAAAAEVDPAAAALFGLVLLTAGLALVPLTIALVRHVFPLRVVFFARWGFSHVAGAVVAFLAGSLLVSVVADEESVGIELFAWNLLGFLPVVAYVVYVAQRMHPEGWRALGFHSGHIVRACVAGVLALVLSVPLLLGCNLLWPWLFERLGGTFEAQRALTAFQDFSGAELVAAVAIAVVIQPLLEELLFRGFLQPLFVQNFGVRGGLAVTSLIFAGLHGDSALLPLFAFSLVLCAVMQRTQRLAAPWLMHALYNGLTLSLFLSNPELATP